MTSRTVTLTYPLTELSWRLTSKTELLTELSWRLTSKTELLTELSWRLTSKTELLTELSWRLASKTELLTELSWRLTSKQKPSFCKKLKFCFFGTFLILIPIFDKKKFCPMSIQLIHQYYKDIERAIKFGGSKNETSIRTPFLNLVNGFARPKGLELVAEISIKTPFGTTIRPDGVLRNILQLDYGFWESKDQKDDIYKEIEDKFKKGYPENNILFEDTHTAVLFQGGKETKVSMQDEEALLQLLQNFISYERPEVTEFNIVVSQFSQELPNILEALRKMINSELISNSNFKKANDKFLLLCQKSISFLLKQEDVLEMLIQHILTEEIFLSIFQNADYHRENNIAQSLYEVEKTFFKGQTKQDLLASIRPYYTAVRGRANDMVSHSDKQRFLKAIYENFYKAYNPKGADRLGIVYTPNEIVKFMIEGTDFLLEKHFGKTLGSKGVEILDPCTGTGTFVTELIEHIPSNQLAHKYEYEIHANEVALLPYYVANLNIEAVFQEKMSFYKEFSNLCFVDTLDNTDPLRYWGKQTLLGSLSMENLERIQKQNKKKISVIIGNPPYNANQQNENENNKNREYTEIDKRIKDTFIKKSTAQKTKVYDMYARFFRWAMDRMNQNGILAFVTNRSFIDSRTFDGFRKIVEQDFQEIWILDTKSDIRANPKIAGTTHNVFGIQTGVCIAFFVKNDKMQKEQSKIYYYSLKDEQKKEEKLAFLHENSLNKIDFERITPDQKGNWINLTDNDFDTLMPVCSKDKTETKVIFDLCSNGVVSSRDEWVCDYDFQNLQNKVRFFCDFYHSEMDRWKKSNKRIDPNDFIDRKIKFGSELVAHLVKMNSLLYQKQRIRKLLYRPYVKKYSYIDKIISHRLYQIDKVFGVRDSYPNQFISITFHSQLEHPSILCGDTIWDYGYGARDSMGLPLYRYENGEKKENITDWALEEFRTHYKAAKSKGKTAQMIEKTDIFHYVYAVLHNPEYRQKYEQNLKRDFPRIPLYEDFWKWAKLGKALMDLHLNYEQAEAYGLERQEKPLQNPNAIPKAKLKAEKSLGGIYIDEVTTLTGVPAVAWDYKLGNRSALEWILDQYKEKKSSDATILEKFNNYHFADYKEEVIELLQKVCTVSVRTMEIIEKMD